MTVAIERRERVMIIRLDRPAKRNAIDPDTTLELDAALNELADSASLWVGILTGAGEYFSAGSDMALTSGDPTVRGGEYGVIRRRRTKPLIAAVEGFALGGGMEIVLACDLVVAGRSSRFGLPEVARGLLPTCGGLFRAQQALPLNIAKQLILTGQPLPAERAWSLGLVNDLVDDGKALEAALALAEQIIANSPTSVSQSLIAIQEVADADDAAGWRATARAIDNVIGGPNSLEGLNSFFEKRPPQWLDG